MSRTYIKKIEITNLGPFENTQLFLEPDYNVIIGPNDVGKSVLLRLIEEASGRSALETKFTHHSYDESKLVVEYSDGETWSTHHGRVKKKGDPGPKLVVVRPDSLEPHCPSHASLFNRVSWGPLASWIVPALKSLNITEEVMVRTPQVRESRIKSLEESLNQGFQNLLGPTFPWLFRFSLNPNNVADLSIEGMDGVRSSPSERGKGFHSILRVAAALISNPNADVVLLDEPETSLHPKAQKDLRNFLVAYSQLSDSPQIVLATHSPHFIDPKLPGSVRLVIRDGQRVQVKNRPSAGNDWLNTFQQVREEIGLDIADTLILGKTVILVEGPTEEKYLGRLLGKYCDHDCSNYAFIPIANKETKAIVKVLKGIGVCFAGVFDGDAPGTRYMEAVREIAPSAPCFQWPFNEFEGVFDETDFLDAVGNEYRLERSSFDENTAIPFSTRVLAWVVGAKPNLNIGKPDLFGVVFREAQPHQTELARLAILLRTIETNQRDIGNVEEIT